MGSIRTAYSALLDAHTSMMHLLRPTSSALLRSLLNPASGQSAARPCTTASAAATATPGQSSAHRSHATTTGTPNQARTTQQQSTASYPKLQPDNLNHQRTTQAQQPASQHRAYAQSTPSSAQGKQPRHLQRCKQSPATNTPDAPYATSSPRATNARPQRPSTKASPHTQQQTQQQKQQQKQHIKGPYATSQRHIKGPSATLQQRTTGPQATVQQRTEAYATSDGPNVPVAAWPTGPIPLLQWCQEVSKCLPRPQLSEGAVTYLLKRLQRVRRRRFTNMIVSFFRAKQFLFLFDHL